MLENVLIIFVKYPEPGLVKTRLAKKTGEYQAAFLYRLFVEAILARIEDVRFRSIIFYSPPEKESKIMDWLGHRTGIYYPQKGDTLGERLSNAFKSVFKMGAKRVVAIGTDSPTIDRRAVLKTFRKLKGKGCVIGPALDGGYYLIGLTSFHKEIFDDVNWGTKSVLKETESKVRELGLQLGLLDREVDIDTFDDLLVLKDGLKDAYKANPIGLTPIINYLEEILYI